MDIVSIVNSPEVVAARTAAVREALLRESPNVTGPNFARIAGSDLERLFGLYDLHFFDGWLARTAEVKAGGAVTFRLSSTMTRAGGKTITTRRMGPKGEWLFRHEIAIASRLLFMTFRDVERPVVVCGLQCADRLDALQRIMEHEIIHLIEMMIWEESSCSAFAFKRLAANIFGHRDTMHALVTPREKAFVRHGVAVGGMVEFNLQGRRLVGKVNRIHQRATVLVEDSQGTPYTDGRRYLKFYVPLERLSAMTGQEG